MVCKACGRNHHEDNCFRRGLAFLPPSEAKRITRYNELHGSKPKIPKTDPLPRPSSPYHSPRKYHDDKRKSRPAAKAAEIPHHSQDDLPDEPADTNTNIATDITDTFFAQDLQDPMDHTPAAQLAEFRYPSANMATVDETVLPITYEEQPELFLTGPFHQHLQPHSTQDWTPLEFHVDFGANIIILNTDKFFHTFRAQKESIEHIAGDTIPG